MVFKNRYYDLNTYLRDRNGFWISVFCKSLYCYLIFKIVFIWNAVETIFNYFPYTPRSWWTYAIYAPLSLAHPHPKVFLVCFLIILIIGLLIKINYVTAILICWCSISLSRLGLPAANGSDLVLNLFLLLAVVMPVTPSSKHLNIKSIQKHISVIGVLLVQIELTLVYFLSGYDKLMSEAWRSGAAIYSIMNLDFFYNPFLKIALNDTTYILLSWSVIIFELAFTFFVWFRKTRMYILMAGVIFHLGIIVFLGLLDFGILMIITYLIFLPINHKPVTQPTNQFNIGF